MSFYEQLAAATASERDYLLSSPIITKCLRGEVTRAVGLRYAPQITFEADPSFDASDRITQLLSDPRVARDLEQPLPREGQKRRGGRPGGSGRGPRRG